MSESLSHHFLIALPTMGDPYFKHTVTYLFDHNSQGAMGITLTRRLPDPFSDILKELDLYSPHRHINKAPVFSGGPVQGERGLILHPSEPNRWSASSSNNHGVSLTASSDILKAIAQNKGPDQWKLCLGHCGWEAGQLESELKENAWLCLPAETDTLFGDTDHSLWQQITQDQGFDIQLISPVAGHA